MIEGNYYRQEQFLQEWYYDPQRLIDVENHTNLLMEEVQVLQKDKQIVQTSHYSFYSLLVDSSDPALKPN
jgi:hypothetical protein